MGLNGAQNYSVRMETIADAIQRGTQEVHSLGVTSAWACPITMDKNGAGGDYSPIIPESPKRTEEFGFDRYNPGDMTSIFIRVTRMREVGGICQVEVKYAGSSTIIPQTCSLFNGWIEVAKEIHQRFVLKS